MKYLKMTCLVLLSVTIALAVPPVKLSLSLGAQAQNAPYRAAEGRGGAVEGKLAYPLTDKTNIAFHVSFDHMVLQEDTVILEWDWPYWDERYIDWLLTGASAQEVDSISRVLEYWRPDSSYHGVFKPRQWMNELRLTLSADIKFPINGSWSIFGNIGGGVSIYQRRLKVVEDWTKVFTWEWDSGDVAGDLLTGDDLENYLIMMDLHDSDPLTYRLDTLSSVYRLTYDYHATITHFAPDKNGLKFYLTPTLGFRYAIGNGIDLDLAYQGLFYLNIAGGSVRETFPVRTKSLVWLGLTFNY
ncbi:MAG: hypothetical protein JXR21_01615 [Candidatus Marinimicrobia bacterium]|nr:hypothetical protein [Candidatus Neomarinimicrobiota bacterium]